MRWALVMFGKVMVLGTLLPVAEHLRHQDEDGNPIAPLYVNLLARAMDRERLGDAHPAFVQVIGQLAPDELLLLQQLQGRPYQVRARPIDAAAFCMAR